ncbi:LysR family transcriptional regulator [Aeromonas jandaei]|uniref:LysR family transcriptional regulator n=1 Tax=Aeromonas jandaei TaxID=650 RepID=A0ABX6ZPU1_AERJA|nr:LysR family transcriptional regulator [Aeromonas jandaei]MCF7718823.1 LysR family transcriptional regulator [Aeromonas jandaei]QNF17016.1 LysR family transcriptional regulator [Aeromonas jandaei]QQB21619.1 LysR family transcriptional regulator [Aeromonas jandaei]RQM73353.1 LysR family transcriptional regulator [Aeromonas jandaei]UCA32438.1 LysR family transcriptional regulator [Aeromonas jandaei]
MDLNAALILVRIVDKGSFTAAAQELGMTKAMVSRRIAELEQRLGVRLLYRSTRQLTLTEEGEKYYRHCSKAVEALTEAELMLSASQQEVTGTLKMAVPIETGQLVVGRLVAKFLQAYPGLQVELELTNRVVDPISEGLDAVVRIGDMSDSNLAARRLWSTGRLLCASPAYLARSPAIKRPEDLANHERVTVSSGFLASHWCFELDGKEVLVDPPSRFRVNNITCAREAAKAGLGLASIPAMLCQEELASGELVAVLPEWQQPKVSIYLLFPERQLMPRKLRAFIDFMVENGAEFGIDKLL